MNKNFIFGQSLSGNIDGKINLREIGKNAKEWFHPYYSFINIGNEIKSSGQNILKVSKKCRESYATSILALSIQESTDEDWWLCIPNNDPPDGYIATFREENVRGKKQIKGKIREVEVVEHRSEDTTLLNRFKNKLVDTSYNTNTVLVCLVLVPGEYNFKKLSQDLIMISSKLKHVFVVLHGVQLSTHTSTPFLKLTAIQLLPEFIPITFDIRNQNKDFQKKFDMGREYRIISENDMHYGTKNLKYKK